ncbi:diguanylate cyclase domain-containing protein [Thiomonas intermedia]|uniref:diguanylate cyclase domain-containing protein n=1 Tax=Thiomonas intermedia TaxID=926 RepID=UPI0009A52DCC|nr:diguanylate cyclase [Thiomonas intermedia]
MQTHSPETSAERDTEPADFIGGLRDVVFRTRGKTFWSYLSPAWTALTGYTVEESLGRNILDFVYPDDRPANSLRKQQLESGEISASRHTKRLLRRDGSFVWIEVDLRVLYDDEGAFLGSVGTIRDISDRIALEQAVRHERERASVTLMALSDGVLTLDPALRIEFLNQAAADLLGLKHASETLDLPVDTVLALASHDLCGVLHDARTSGRTRTLADRCRHPGTEADWVEVDLTLIPLSAAQQGCVIVLRDVREQRALQARLHHQARHDALTQTLNRTGMLDELRHAHATFAGTGATFSQILVDLDHFKLVNDHHGHATGDEALRQVAQAIQGVLRADDHLARWGGEEFLCLLPHTTLEQGFAIAERIRGAVQALELRHGGQPIPLSVSAGVSAASADRQDTLEQVLQRADFSLYEAKQAGRNCVWHERMAGQGVLDLVSQVQEALRADQLELVYQPIVSLATGERVGQEGYARIRLRDGVEIKAARFIPALQQMHRAYWVDERVIPRVLDDGLQGRLRGDSFVNLSADLLRRPTVMHALLDGFLRRAGRDSGARPLGKLVLELGNRPLQLDVAAVRAALQPWLDAGVRLAVNQSGSGLSTMAYWTELPIHFLKIHATLLERAASTPKARLILSSIVQLARQLDCVTVAEQVDQPALVDVARDLGLDWLQGDLTGKAQHGR